MLAEKHLFNRIMKKLGGNRHSFPWAKTLYVTCILSFSGRYAQAYEGTWKLNWIFLPVQVLPSSLRRYPALQLHKYPFSVLVQVWLQLSSSAAHSSISVKFEHLTMCATMSSVKMNIHELRLPARIILTPGWLHQHLEYTAPTLLIHICQVSLVIGSHQALINLTPNQN